MNGSVAQFGRAVSVCKGREPWFSVPCPVEKLQVVRPSAGPRTRTRRSNPSTPLSGVKPVPYLRVRGLATPLTATKTCSVVPSVLGARRKTAPLFLAGYGVEAETLSLDYLRKKGEMVSLTPVSILQFPIATEEVEN